MGFHQRRPIALFIALVAGCASFGAVRTNAGEDAAGLAAKPRYAATISPIAALVRDLARGRGEVACLLSPSASPHTYEPRPSDARQCENALALFYAQEDLDGWATKLPGSRKVEVFDMLPPERRLYFEGGVFDHEHGRDHDQDHDHDHQGVKGEGVPKGAAYQASRHPDGHFWTDPQAVEAVIAPLTRVLGELDPDGKAIYETNARRLEGELREADLKAADILKPARGQAVLLFHPSLQYLLRRYDLKLAGSIEPAPGREPTPRYLAEMTEKLKRAGARAVFTEPQLSPRPAAALAEAAGLPLRQLDPYGGGPGLERLPDLILFNARALAEALK